MKRTLLLIFQALLIGLSLFVLAGCVEVISAVGTGAYMTAEYFVSGAAIKTVSYELNRIKEALLVALCRMQIRYWYWIAARSLNAVRMTRCSPWMGFIHKCIRSE